MTPLEQAFEAAYLRDRDPNSPITKDALLRGADGQYFHQHTRTYFGFFCMGYSRGHSDARAVEAVEEDPCAGGHIPIGWTGTVHCEVCNKKLGDEPIIDQPSDEEPPNPWIQPGCPGCGGKGDGQGNECPRCWEIPF